MGCNLSSKRRIPPSGNGGATRWAATLRSEMVTPDEIPVTLDEKLPTVRAPGVLPVADHAWHVPGIDVTQACLLSRSLLPAAASRRWCSLDRSFCNLCERPLHAREYPRTRPPETRPGESVRRWSR